MTTHLDTSVLIVGAGPVGLALALDLGWRGIDCIVVEQGDGSVATPKLGAVGIRTMEFCRRWGIADAVRSTPFERDYKLDMVFCTAMTGYGLARHSYPSLADDPVPPQSPEKKWRCPQLWFDPLLAEAARGYRSVDLRYRHRFLGATQQHDRVEARVEQPDGKGIATIRADYLVGCDGAGSQVRRDLGIEMQGRAVLDHSAGVFLRSPELKRRHDKGEAERYIFLGPNGTWGNLSAIDGRELWRLTVFSTAAEVDGVCAQADRHVRRAFGDDSIPFDIISVLPWRRSELTASRYQQGRIFLCGDSAHAMSPTGGFGMNTGLGDVVDLGWKIEARLAGWGGAQLLDSYTVERQPIGARNAGASAHNYFALTSVKDAGALLDAGPAGDGVRADIGAHIKAATLSEWETLGIHLGYRYEGSPIIVPDGTPAPEDHSRFYEQTARPGHRAPHGWLADGRSTLDLFGRGFVLLQFPQAPDPAPLIEAFRGRGVPLAVEQVADPGIAALYGANHVLVRPDGHVAWRGTAGQADAGHVVDTVRGHQQ